jgi:hypothetical protein
MVSAANLRLCRAQIISCFLANCNLILQWSVGTILMGLYSFMQDSDITNGSVESTKAEKVQFAKDSLEFNVQNK